MKNQRVAFAQAGQHNFRHSSVFTHIGVKESQPIWATQLWTLFTAKAVLVVLQEFRFIRKLGDTMRNRCFIRLLLLALVLMAIPATAPIASGQIGFGISVGFAPPPLPVYEQPICPGDGYIWTPGYWAYDYDDEDYYWVPGTWVIAPRIGYLWTPGYWGWGGSGYFWHGGYWGQHVGFYGGVDYGFGYGGFGYEGGRWDHDRFFYNTSVNNVNITNIHNTYNTTVINNNNTNINRVSYNGGAGGINARATAVELAANREGHIAATSWQVRHEHIASANRAQFASVNNGQPAVAATARPAVFSGRGVVAATAAGSRTTNIVANTNRPTNSARPTSNVYTPRAANNLGRSSNNSAVQNRNAQRDNVFAHPQNNQTRAQGGSGANQTFANRPPSNATRQQQFNTQRNATNNTQNNSRQFANRPSYSAPVQRSAPSYTQNDSRQFANRPPYSAPAQRNAANNTQNNSRQLANRPSYSAPAQRNNVTRPQSNPVFHQNPQPSPAFRQSTSHVAPQVPARQYATPQQHPVPSYSSRPSAPQYASAPRQQSVPQRSVPQSQPRADSRPTNGKNGGNHSGDRR